MDNDDILEEIGFTAQEIEKMYEDGLLRKSDYVGGL